MILSVALVGLLGLSLLTLATADEAANRDKCVAKGEEAVKLIQEVGHEAALERINDKEGPFKWKGGYVWVIEDKKATILAHAGYPEAVGSEYFNMRDADGKLYCQEMIRIAKTKGKGWIACNRSFGKRDCYALKVPDQNLVVVSVLLKKETQAYGAEMSAEQKEVLEWVKTGWQLWKRGNIETFTESWHKDSIWLLEQSSVPQDKKQMAKIISFNITSFELKPIQIRVVGNVAAIMYYWSYTTQAGQVISGRMSLTNIKQDGKWLTLGGMFASCIQPPPCPF